MRRIDQLVFAGVLVIPGLLAINRVLAQAIKPAPDPSKVAQNSTSRRGDAVAEAGATSKSILALPFKRSWEYLTDSMLLFAPTVDGDRIYQPLQEGRVICLERRSGSLLWSTDSGGQVTAPVAIGESERGSSAIFVASEMLADSGWASTGLLRALDPATGVTLWSRNYPRPFKSPIVAAGRELYVGSADGSLYAMSVADGQVLWKVQTQDVVNGTGLVTGKAVYFGSDDGALRAVDRESGRQMWKYQTTGPITCLPAVDDKHVYFGSGDGCIYSVDLLDGRLKWKSRTGAAVAASPVLAGDKLIVGSMDNFLYAMSRSTGDRLWKRRLDNRIVFPVIIEGDAVMVAPFRGDHVPIFLLSDGRRVNSYRLNRGYEIAASLSFVDGILLVPTDKGLVAAVTIAPAKPDEASKGTNQQTPPTPDTAGPIKKPGS